MSIEDMIEGEGDRLQGEGSLEEENPSPRLGIRKGKLSLILAQSIKNCRKEKDRFMRRGLFFDSKMVSERANKVLKEVAIFVNNRVTEYFRGNSFVLKNDLPQFFEVLRKEMPEFLGNNPKLRGVYHSPRAQNEVMNFVERVIVEMFKSLLDESDLFVLEDEAGDRAGMRQQVEGEEDRLQESQVSVPQAQVGVATLVGQTLNGGQTEDVESSKPSPQDLSSPALIGYLVPALNENGSQLEEEEGIKQDEALSPSEQNEEAFEEKGFESRGEVTPTPVLKSIPEIELVTVLDKIRLSYIRFAISNMVAGIKKILLCVPETSSGSYILLSKKVFDLIVSFLVAFRNKIEAFMEREISVPVFQNCANAEEFNQKLAQKIGEMQGELKSYMEKDKVVIDILKKASAKENKDDLLSLIIPDTANFFTSDSENFSTESEIKKEEIVDLSYKELLGDRYASTYLEIPIFPEEREYISQYQDRFANVDFNMGFQDLITNGDLRLRLNTVSEHLNNKFHAGVVLRKPSDVFKVLKELAELKNHIHQTSDVASNSPLAQEATELIAWADDYIEQFKESKRPPVLISAIKAVRKKLQLIKAFTNVQAEFYVKKMQKLREKGTSLTTEDLFDFALEGIPNAQENVHGRTFDLDLYEFRLKKINEQIAQLEKIIKETKETLKDYDLRVSQKQMKEESISNLEKRIKELKDDDEGSSAEQIEVKAKECKALDFTLRQEKQEYKRLTVAVDSLSERKAKLNRLIIELEDLMRKRSHLTNGLRDLLTSVSIY